MVELKVRTIVKHPKYIISLFILFAVGIFIYLPSIQSSFDRSVLEYSKEEHFVKRVVSYDKLYWIERNQRELLNTIDSEDNRQWLADEISDGAVKVRYNLDFMIDNPEYDLVEIRFPVIQYNDGGKRIEFISNTGVITRVHSQNGWQVNTSP